MEDILGIGKEAEWKAEEFRDREVREVEEEEGTEHETEKARGAKRRCGFTKQSGWFG